jgi:two-component system, chemotaxis family, CheB/CheR fusion protein
MVLPARRRAWLTCAHVTGEEMDDQLAPLLDHLRDARGVDFTGYKRSSLTRRVRKRMDVVRAGSIEEYLALLERSDDELAALLDTILINVTSFFRDPETWDAVAEKVIPDILAARAPGEPVRAWVAGCATGEEAYTVAMLLCEAMGEDDFRQRAKVYATDADHLALVEARRARYPAAALAEAPEGMAERYFVQDGGHLVFRKELRRSVIFGAHNLVQDPPISRIDLLSCRNTLMYFTHQTQAHVLRQLRFALQPSGYLVLGRSEALATRTNLFTPLDLKRRLFRRTQASKERLVPEDDHATAQPADGTPPRRRTDIRAAAFEVAPVAQTVIDRDGVLVALNHQARSLFGLTSRDVGRPLRDLELSYRPLELRQHVDTVWAKRHAVTVRAVEWRRGVDTEWFDVTLQPVVAETGELEGTHVSFVDVTPQQVIHGQLERAQLDLETAYEELQSAVEELETTNEELQSTNEELETTNEELQSTNEELETTNEELQSTNEELETINDELRQRTTELDEVNVFLQAILTSLQSAVVVVDRDLRVQVWNDHAHELWGLRADEVDGEHLMNLDIGLPVEHLRQPLRACLAGEQPEDLVLDAVNRRGRPVECHIRAAPLRDTRDETIGAILVIDAVDAAAASSSG